MKTLFKGLLVTLLVYAGLSLLGCAANFTLTVFGNANLDDAVNAEDIEYLKGILNGTKNLTEFADANFDGNINESDIGQIQAIIDGTRSALTIKENSGRIVTIKMPV